MWYWRRMNTRWKRGMRRTRLYVSHNSTVIFHISHFQKSGRIISLCKMIDMFKAIIHWKSYSAGTWSIAYWNFIKSISLLTVYSIQGILFTYFLPINNTLENKPLWFSIFPLMKSSKNKCSSSKEPVLVITTWMLHSTLH